MVLPLFILIIVSLIGACIFKFASFRADCNVQKEIINAIREEKALMKKIERSTSTTSGTGGFYLYELSKNYNAYGYVIDEATMVRTSEFFVE